MNVFLDIDGVCCDFSHLIAEATGTDKPMESYTFDDFTPEQAAAAKAALPRAYTEGRPYEGMAELSHRLAEHNEVRYLTARPEGHRVKTCEWLREHGFYMGTVIFNRDKALILSCYPDAVIVEDYGKNIEEILDGSDAKVIALMMPKQRYTFNWFACDAEYTSDVRFYLACPVSLTYVLREAGVKFEDKKEENSMNLEEGKRYVTRIGKVTSKMEPLYDCYPFMAWVDGYGGASWTNDGRYSLVQGGHDLDIVAEYKEPTKVEAPVDYKAQLTSFHKSRTVRLLETDEGFAKAAEELAQKLSHAFLVNPFAQLKRRKGQSPVLWEAACLLIERAGVVVEFCDECVKIH
jgi:hypothetical protein